MTPAAGATTTGAAAARAPVQAVELDHLVVAAATLAQGAAWCERVLGVAPGPGGRHATMGTHNRLLRLDGPAPASPAASAPASPAAGGAAPVGGRVAASPRLYLEVIAVDPDAPAPPHPRWFGLDVRQRSLAADGPRLVHWVARTDTLAAHRAALLAAGHAPGEPTAFARGDYRWQMLVRADGALACGGALPTLLQWSSPHPVDAMPASGLALASLTLRGLPPGTGDALGLQAAGGVVAIADGGGPALQAWLRTPRGDVRLDSMSG